MRILGLLKRFLTFRVAFPVLRLFDRVVSRASLVGDSNVVDNSYFDWPQILNERWREIRAEAEEVVRSRHNLPNLQKVVSELDRLNSDDRWKTFYLYGYGTYQSLMIGPDRHRFWSGLEPKPNDRTTVGVLFSEWLDFHVRISDRFVQRLSNQRKLI